MRLRNASGGLKRAGLETFMAAAGLAACSEMRPLAYPQEAEMNPPVREAENLTIGIERSQMPPRLSANIVDTSLSTKQYSGFCWLLYGGEEGSMLLNPNANSSGRPEFIGKVMDGAVVRVSPRIAEGKTVWDVVKGDGGRPETLYRLRNGITPLADALFWKHSEEVCRKTEEPRVSVYGKDLQIAVVLLGPK